MEFKRFVSRHVPGLRVLSLSTPAYVPGVVLDTEKLRLLGHCRQVLPGEPDISWSYTQSEASIIYGSVSNQRQLSSGGKILGVISLKGGIERELRVHIDISDVRGKFLYLNQLALQPKLNELRRTDRRGRWRQINNRFVVLETFYAAAFEAKFYRRHQLLSQTDMEHIPGVRLEAGLDYSWKADHKLVIADNDRLPFGVRGFTV